MADLPAYIISYIANSGATGGQLQILMGKAVGSATLIAQINIPAADSATLATAFGKSDGSTNNVLEPAASPNVPGVYNAT